MQGTLASPPAESAYHMATAANTMPESAPPTAPRSNRAARGSFRLFLLTAMSDHLHPRSRRTVPARHGMRGPGEGPAHSAPGAGRSHGRGGRPHLMQDGGRATLISQAD